MKVNIVGVGRLGSQVAWNILREFKPEVLMLVDKKDLHGDILDLQHACKGMNIKTKITEKLEIPDYLILTAGMALGGDIKNHDEIFDVNKKIILDILKKVPFDKKTKIIVMTNPVDKLTEIVKKELSDNLVVCPEKELIEMRDNVDYGKEIIKTKGYTNFGAAVSCVKLIKSLEQK